MEPSAYDVALSPELLAKLGEIVVILGQIDDDMAQSLTGLLGVSRDAASRLMRTQDPVDLWASCLRGRLDHEDFDHAVALAASEVKGVQQDRNAFVHADYSPAFEFQGGWVTVRGITKEAAEAYGSTVVATALRNQKIRQASELDGVRNRAARASRLVAHVVHSVAPHGSWDASPWFQSVEPILAKSAGRAAKPGVAPRQTVTFDNLRPSVPESKA